MLRRIGSGANRIDINPPAMINCAMVAGLHTWVEKVLQPAAQASFGSPITRLRSASGYTCRNRVGSRSHVNADKLSEHARANAIDIAGFVTADGRTIEVGRFWGPTARDLRDGAKTAAAPARDAKPETVRPEPAKAQADHRLSAISGVASEPAKAKDRATQRTAELSRLGRGTSDISADPKAIPAPPVKEVEDVSKSKEAMFLRDLHKGACGVFGTVLGPEANEAHRDHFHFDLAARRRNAFCE
jgi:Extensin-like protein C-terminus